MKTIIKSLVTTLIIFIVFNSIALLIKSGAGLGWISLIVIFGPFAKLFFGFAPFVAYYLGFVVPIGLTLFCYFVIFAILLIWFKKKNSNFSVSIEKQQS